MRRKKSWIKVVTGHSNHGVLKAWGTVFLLPLTALDTVTLEQVMTKTLRGMDGQGGIGRKEGRTSGVVSSAMTCPLTLVLTQKHRINNPPDSLMQAWSVFWAPRRCLAL